MTRQAKIEYAIRMIFEDICYQPPEMLEERIRMRVTDLVSDLENEDSDDTQD